MTMQLLFFFGFFVMIFVIYLLKHYSKRPPTITTKIILWLTNIVIFILYEIFGIVLSYWSFFMIRKYIQIRSLGSVYNIIFTLIYQICYLYFNLSYRQSLQSYSLKRDTQCSYQFLLLTEVNKFSIIVLTAIFSEVPLLATSLLSVSSIIFILILIKKQFLGYTLSSLWLQITVQFFYSILLFESIVQIICVLTQKTQNTQIFRILGYICIALIQYPFYIRYKQKFIKIIPIKDGKLYSSNLSKQFILQLAAYFGPEFIGTHKLNYMGDFSNLTQQTKLTMDQSMEIAKLIGQCEQQLEDFKLLYENVFSNIFLSYAMCGQTLEHVSLFDIEEALPIPLLLMYLQTWKTPDIAYSSILFYIKQIRIFDQVRNSDLSYRPVHPLDCFGKFTSQEQHLKFILERSCAFRDIQVEDIIKKDDDYQKVKDKNSINPELALFKSNYQLPSQQKFCGGLYIIHKQDIQNYSFLFDHCRCQDKDNYYVLVPTLSQLSSVSGNLHRLSFNNMTVSSQTQVLRQIRTFALISLARILFPLKQPIDGRFYFPLSSSFKFTQYSQSNERNYLNYGNSFMLQLFSQKQKYNSKKLYQFAPFLISQQEQFHTDAQLLQFILVEFFQTRLVTTLQSSPRVFKFLSVFYNQHYQFIHKLMTYQECYFESQEVCTIPNMLVLNALIIQFSSAIIDERASSFVNVVQCLISNRLTYISRYSNCSYKKWTQYMKIKLQLHLNQSFLEYDLMEGIKNIVSYLTEFEQYQLFVDQLEQSIQEKHLNLINEVAKFLNNYHALLYQLFIQTNEENHYEPSRLLYECSFNNNQDLDECETDLRINYDSCMLIHDSEIEYNQKFSLQTSQYNFIRLSNLVYYLQIQMQLQFSQKDSPLKLFREGQKIDNSLLGLSVFIDFLQQDIVKEQNGYVYEYSIQSCSSSSSSFSDISDDDSLVEDEKSYLNIDINLNNPQNFEDDFSLINTNYYFMDNENILKFNHQPDQNTPEFLISVLKQDFKIIKYPTVEIYQQLVHLLTSLHNIKINDNTIRAKNSIYFIIPRLYNIQLALEQLVQRFFKQLQEVKQNNNLSLLNRVQLEQAISSISLIENQITRLFNARSLLLKRQFISDDQFLIIKSDILRSFDLTYGYPSSFIFEDKLNEKQQLIKICQAFSGTNTQIQQQILQYGQSLQRCGGYYAFSENYQFRRHKSWKMGFLWENKLISQIQEQNLSIASPTLVDTKNDDNFKDNKQCNYGFQKNNKKHFIKSMSFCTNNYFFILLILLIAMLSSGFCQYFFSNNMLVINNLYESNLQLSKAIFEAQNIFDDINVVSQRNNFESLENSTYLTLNFNKFRQGQESLLKSFILANSINKRASFAQIYDLILRTNIFETNYSVIHNYDKQKINYCNISESLLDQNIIQVINEIQFLELKKQKINKDIFANITSDKIYDHFFNKLNYFLPYYKKGFTKQKYIFFINDQFVNITLLQAQLQYIYQTSCILQSTITNLYSGQTYQQSKNLYSIITKQLINLQNSYIQVFDDIFNQQVQTLQYQNEVLMKILLAFFVIIIFLILFIQQQFYLKQITQNLIISNIDRGSIISQLIQLPTELLRNIKNKYRTASKLTTLISDYQCIFSVDKHQQIISQANIPMQAHIQGIKRLLTPFFNATQNYKKNIFIIFIFISTILRLFSLILIFVNITPQFQYSKIQTFNQYINDEPAYFKKPSIIGKLDIQLQEVQEFFANNNLDFKKQSIKFDLPLINNYKCLNDKTSSINQISVDFMWIQKWSVLIDKYDQLGQVTQLQSLLNNLPFYELLRLINNLFSQLKIYPSQEETEFVYSLVQLVESLKQKYPQLNVSSIQFLQLQEKVLSFNQSVAKIKIIIKDSQNQIKQFRFKLFIVIIQTLYFIISLFQEIQLLYLVIQYIYKTNINNIEGEKFQQQQFYYIKNLIYGDYQIIIFIVILILHTITLIIQAYFYFAFTIRFAKDNQNYLQRHFNTLSVVEYFQLFLQQFSSILEISFSNKAFYILGSLGFPQEEKTITIQERLEFPKILYQNIDQDLICQQTFIYQTSNYVLPYPSQSKKQHIYDQIVYYLNIVFSLIVILVLAFQSNQNTVDSAFNQLSRYQTINNMISTQSLSYFTHTNDFTQQIGLFYNLFSEQKDISLFLKNSDIAGANIYKQFVKDIHYNNPTYYQFIDQIQDTQFLHIQSQMFNLGNYQTNQILYPSLQYGITNMSYYLQLQPPRLNRYGIHLQEDISQFTLASTIQGNLQVESILQQNIFNEVGDDLSVLATTMTPGGSFGPQEMNLTLQQQIILVQTKQRQENYWNTNRANNVEISKVCQQAIHFYFEFYQKVLWVIFLFLLFFSILIVIITQTIIQKINDYISSTNIFTSLFLKRIRGIKD